MGFIVIDERSKKQIKTLQPEAQAWAEAHLEAIQKSGILPEGTVAKIISGNRTWEEQDELYAKGRTKPGPKVTNARGGQSNHNFGIAWDIGLFKGSIYLEESPLYAKLGPVGEEIGLEWGARWHSFPDEPHYQVPVGLTLAQMRDLFITGGSLPIPSCGQNGQPPIAVPAERPVAVLDGSTKTDVPAFFKEGRVWVAVRPFVEVFGGHVEEVKKTDKPGEISVTLGLNGEVFTVDGFLKDDRGYARFIDVNKATEWGYLFKDDQLIVVTKPKS